MNTRRIETLTKEIMKSFENTGKGHCARVDFLGREESEAICHLFTQLNQNSHIKTYILSNTSNQNGLTGDHFYISADYAIELRNRKEKTLCLFVPMDMVDATVSSLANSFAVIDGRTLYDRLLKQLRSRLSVQAQKIVQTLSQQLRGSMKASKEQLISFIDTILDYEEQGKLAQVGLELWRIGLISDARPAFADEQPTFVDFLDNNRRCVRALTRPAKLQASLLERIQSLLTDEATGRQLTTYFRNRNLQDVRNWSQALIDQGLTFDCWRFPDEDRSDIKGVTVQRFLNASGEVEKYSHLKQPNGAQTSLQVRCGQKSTVVVRWKTEPPNPHNLKYWRVEMLSSNEEPNQESLIDLPVHEISASRRNLSIKLDFELERPLGVHIRVTPIEMSGQASVHPDTKEAIYDDSNEFFLMPESDGGNEEDTPVREVYRDVSTLALGRLEQAMQTREDQLKEAEPQWNSKELEYFSLRLDNKRVISIGLSAILKDIEERTIQNAYDGGMFQLFVDEIRPVSSDKCQARPSGSLPFKCS